MNFLTRFTISLLLLVVLSAANGSESKPPANWKFENGPVSWLPPNSTLRFENCSNVSPEDPQIQIWDRAKRKLIGDLPVSNDQTAWIIGVSDDGRRLVVVRGLYFKHMVGPENHALYDTDAYLKRCEGWSLGKDGKNPRLLWQLRSRNNSAVFLSAAFQGKKTLLLRPNRIETLDEEGRLVHTVGLKLPRSAYDMMIGTLSPDGQFAVVELRISRCTAAVCDTRSGKIIRTFDFKRFHGDALPPSANPPSFLAEISLSSDGKILHCLAMDATDPGPDPDQNWTVETSIQCYWTVKTGKLLFHKIETSSFG